MGEEYLLPANGPGSLLYNQALKDLRGDGHMLNQKAEDPKQVEAALSMADLIYKDPAIVAAVQQAAADGNGLALMAQLPGISPAALQEQSKKWHQDMSALGFNAISMIHKSDELKKALGKKNPELLKEIEAPKSNDPASWKGTMDFSKVLSEKLLDSFIFNSELPPTQAAEKAKTAPLDTKPAQPQPMPHKDEPLPSPVTPNKVTAMAGKSNSGDFGVA